jgi:hypothetical protein
MGIISPVARMTLTGNQQLPTLIEYPSSGHQTAYPIYLDSYNDMRRALTHKHHDKRHGMDLLPYTEKLVILTPMSDDNLCYKQTGSD